MKVRTDLSRVRRAAHASDIAEFLEPADRSELERQLADVLAERCDNDPTAIADAVLDLLAAWTASLPVLCNPRAQAEIEASLRSAGRSTGAPS